MLNDTKVFPARLRGTKESGGKVEVLLLERFPEEGRSLWIALVDAAKKPQLGARIDFDHRLSAEVIGDMGRGRFGLEFHHEGDFEAILDALGEPPLPPYVRRNREAQASTGRAIKRSTRPTAAPSPRRLRGFTLRPSCWLNCKRRE